MLETAVLHLSLDQDTQTKTKSIDLKYTRSIGSNVAGSVTIGENSEIKLVSPCKILSLTDEICSDTSMTQQTYALRSAVTGMNGKDELNLWQSKSIGLSFYDDDKIEIPIRNKKEDGNFEFWIERDTSLIKNFDFVFVNTKNYYSSLVSNQVFSMKFELKDNDVSVHFHIRPENVSVSYLILLKYANETNVKKFDLWKIFCPKG